MQLEQILGHIAVGAAVLDDTDWRVLYSNQYLVSLLNEPWRSQGVVGHRLAEILPPELVSRAVPYLQRVSTTRQSLVFQDVPYEGLLASRGRTYWRISLIPVTWGGQRGERWEKGRQEALLITVEDVTSQVRSRLLLKAMQHISAAIAGPFALPEVLDRILQAVQEMVGSTRCAILLLEPVTEVETVLPDIAQARPPVRQEAVGESEPLVTLAAQKGLHPSAQQWRPRLNERLLLSRALREQRALIIEDTGQCPELELPLLDDDGLPRRPGSVLCVPIFDPHPEPMRPIEGRGTQGQGLGERPPVVGTIEVYHRRARGFPAEEVELLEQFARQAGLAIHNARLFFSINSLARTASRNVRQRENIMQAIPDGVVIYDARWRVADMNHAVRRLLGWSDEVLGLPIWEALARSQARFEEGLPRGPEDIPALERRALEHSVDEIKVIGADGRPYVIRRSYAPIHDAVGDIFAFLVIYHDVTEQAAARERIEAEVVARTLELAQRNQALQEAKAALEEESARMQTLLERLPSGVLLISKEARERPRISIINRQAARLLRRMGVPEAQIDDPEEIIRRLAGRPSEEIIDRINVYGPNGELMAVEERPLARALFRGEASESELHLSQPDGTTLFLLASAAPLRASDGTISGALLVWHEITRMKELEREREDFFTTMAHELKTPLANIRAHLSALQADDLRWSLEEQRDFLRTADEQVERLVSMVNQFLDAARVEAGALRLELEPVLLSELVEDLQERLEALIASSHRSLEVRVPAQLPTVLADYEMIIRVLTNLLSNAFYHAPEGDTVLLEAEQVSPREVEIRVTDHGPGLTPEQQEELFTRFSTFAASRRPAADRPGQPARDRRRDSARWSPGTGLGLYISRGIIEAHQSALTLHSSPGQGTTFAFRLSIAGEPTTAQPLLPASAPRGNTTGSREGAHDVGF
ncbi:PAS domain-containing protein [Thermogemmatispora sp.]|uniref:PAS domain-containing protein n=1 Tax=Thermogemmatispora sp. TaxID=1968838 RepID=UPI001D810D39|nr:PAS domain-containing protein [Thermogemmatispora sp.]MBX5449584.1 PAS domain-containing protein [Thermogemmatispora sp.]